MWRQKVGHFSFFKKNIPTSFTFTDIDNKVQRGICDLGYCCDPEAFWSFPQDRRGLPDAITEETPSHEGSGRAAGHSGFSTDKA